LAQQPDALKNNPFRFVGATQRGCPKCEMMYKYEMIFIKHRQPTTNVRQPHTLCL